ncbi:subtilisin-like protease [Typha angustifolia]|uniref:subtilisin-like protease n=1 Tax=Typha angustifolia TaxID=59011 RepID=UPI003C2C4B1E
MLSFLLLFLLFLSGAAHDASTQKTYIVGVRPPERTGPTGREDLENWYISFFPPSTAASAKSRFIYTYSDVITGFVANLTHDELKHMEKKEDFLVAYEDRLLPLLTTHSPDFLGLQPGNGFWDGSGMGKGVIVGLLDSGIKPGHPSFNDEGMPPPPSKWKGTCEFNNSVGCNNKVIGAKTFLHTTRGAKETEKRRPPPIDVIGHGTHTASTAVGNFVNNANVIGNCNGTAAGMAPFAHLAVYKVCESYGCFQSDILAGMDAAIQDGVDVISLSLGSINPLPLYQDVIAVGAYRALKKGIFVSCAAGNSGPGSVSLSNEAPWVLTVGAGTMDRKIRVTVKLGNGEELQGESAFQPTDYNSTMLPLVYPESSGLANCNPSTLADVKGKIVVCNRIGSRTIMGAVVKDKGGAAMIIANSETDGYTTLAEAHYLPAAHVSFADASKIKPYITNSTSTPTASISFQGTILQTSPAPTVASFSSRGPSVQSPGVLKPDVIGPGVNVLAAWPFQIGPNKKSTSNAAFNVISGTSMSTPHLSGIAALIKSKHPDWCPAMIRSAIMTTSDVVDRDGKPIMDEKLNPATSFSMGAGHVNPSRADEPGLVYDTMGKQYIAYLCGLGYTDKQIEYITQNKTDCSKSGSITGAELNYPSFMIELESNSVVTVNRTVTNVGEEGSKYTAKVDVPKGASVTVSPKTLKFSKVKEKKSYQVTVRWGSNGETSLVEGSLKWVSDKYVVRSPIVIVKKV